MPSTNPDRTTCGHGFAAGIRQPRLPAPSGQHAPAACASGHRRPLSQLRERDRPRDQLHVRLDRPTLAVGDRILHTDAQVPAGRQGREHDVDRPAADAGGRERGPGRQVAQGLLASDERLGGARACRRARSSRSRRGRDRRPATRTSDSRRCSDVRWPRSKISYSGMIPRSCIRVCRSTMNSQRFENTSSPKLTVPIVQEAMSGSASSTAKRAASGSVTAPPDDSWTIRSVSARSACTVASRRPGSRVGFASASRMCTWITLAPTDSHSLAPW